MIKVLTSSSTDRRQSELHSQILEASQSQVEQKLAWLQAKWVHRYGLEGLPLNQEKKSDNERQLPSNKIFNEGVGSSKQGACSIELSTEEKISFDDCKEKQVIEDLIAKGLELKLKKEVIQKDGNPGLISPPPPPTALNHLRRWLPKNQDDLADVS